MARMHSRKKGTSGSTKPIRSSSPDWVPLEPNEIVNTVLRLAKEGQSPAVIGLRLRDIYGVPDIKLATGKSLTDILKENGIKMDFPEDMMYLMKRLVKLHDHISKHSKDIHNRRSLTLLEAKIRRLEKYYRRMGKIPANWRYSIDSLRLIVE